MVKKNTRHRKTELNLIASQQQVQYFFLRNTIYESFAFRVCTEKFKEEIFEKIMNNDPHYNILGHLLARFFVAF